MAIGQGAMSFNTGVVRREEMFELQRNLTEYMNLVRVRNVYCLLLAI